MKRYPKPTIGDKIDNWTVVDDVPVKYKKYRVMCYKVRCSCGNDSMLPLYQLYSGQATKCGSCGSKSGSSERHLGTDTVIGKYLSNCRYRAKQKNMEYNLDPSYLEDLFIRQDGRCALTNVPLQLRVNSKDFEFTASLDRIDSNKGYVEGNVQWVHKWINTMKMDLPQEKFYELCRAVVNNTQFFGTRVFARFTVEGIHRWAKCPIEEVSYLRDYHRHVFHINCTKSVYHDDRDVEFIQLSHDIKQYLTDRYYSKTYNCLFFDDMSCEMIAHEILHKFNLNSCEVNEDGEGGAIVGTI